jgi:hypothetical protein
LCSALGARGCYDRKGPFEFYHIERCTDPDCRWSNMSNSPDLLPPPDINYLLYNVLEESTTSFNTIQGSSGNNEMSMTHFQKSSFMSITDNRVRRLSLAGVLVSKVKMDNLAHSIVNIGIKPPNRRPEEETKGSLGINFPEQHRQKSFEKTRLRRQSSGLEYGIQVTRLRSKLPIVDYQSSLNNPCPSIIGNTIHLDRYDEFQPSLNTPKIDRDQSNTHYVQSRPLQMKITEHRPSQIDTIEMLPSVTAPTIENRKTSSSVVHIKRIRKAQNKINGESVTAPFHSIVEEARKEKRHD